MQPGEYNREDNKYYIVQQKNKKWRLEDKDRKKIGLFPSKKSAQIETDILDNNVDLTEPTVPTIEDAEKAIIKGKAPVEVDSSLRSIRLSIDSIAFALNSLAVAIRELAEIKLKKYQ